VKKKMKKTKGTAVSKLIQETVGWTRPIVFSSEDTETEDGPKINQGFERSLNL
jgi:hypothetical protein